MHVPLAVLCLCERSAEPERRVDMLQSQLRSARAKVEEVEQKRLKLQEEVRMETRAVEAAEAAAAKAKAVAAAVAADEQQAQAAEARETRAKENQDAFLRQAQADAVAELQALGLAAWERDLGAEGTPRDSEASGDDKRGGAGGGGGGGGDEEEDGKKEGEEEGEARYVYDGPNPRFRDDSKGAMLRDLLHSGLERFGYPRPGMVNGVARPEAWFREGPPLHRYQQQQQWHGGTNLGYPGLIMPRGADPPRNARDELLRELYHTGVQRFGMRQSNHGKPPPPDVRHGMMPPGPHGSSRWSSGYGPEL